jgi:hypothetical protein
VPPTAALPAELEQPVPRFRPATPDADARPVTPGGVAELAADVLAPAHFFAAPGLDLAWDHAPAEEVSWEVFHGRLLDPGHTRLRRTFAAWSLYAATPGGRSDEPLLSLKLDAAAGELHVVRGLESYVWEGYDAGGNVIESRERRKWVRELTGTVRLDRFTHLGELHDELICRLFHAVVGASRLPLSSVEAPLPAFSFGELFYCYRPWAAVGDRLLRTAEELAEHVLAPGLAPAERARLLETFLHAAPAGRMTGAARTWMKRWAALGGTPADLAALLRRLFNDVSLSPWTDLADRVLAFLGALEELGYFDAAGVVDFLGHLLRQTGRHLTAYDLVTFHHQGANYPDALLLDVVLKAYLAAIDRRPDLFAPDEKDKSEEETRKRLRRRALRQGWLLRRRYEGHPVPDRPTSPGENSRVLPAGHPRVPEEQILHPHRRTRRLYAGDPLDRHLGPHARQLLRQAFEDLAHPDERRELGLGLFIDRPFGGPRHPAEPDGTLLLASAAYSRSVAQERLRALAREVGLAADGPEVEALRADFDIPGLPLDAIGPAARPGAVTLADARRAAPDFVFLWTTRGGVRSLLEQFDFSPLGGRCDPGFLDAGRVLVARSAHGPGVRIYDDERRPRLEVEVSGGEGYESRAGQEYPAGGLLVVRRWRPVPGGLEEADLRADPIRLPPR